jgi:hypothetical protein
MVTGSRPFWHILVCSILLTLLLTACRSDSAPTAAPTIAATLPPRVTHAPTVASAASATAVATEPPSATSTVVPSSTPLSPQPATSTARPEAPAPPTLTPPSLALTIDSFSVAADDIDAGKRLTFIWETTGADKVRIHSGTVQRMAPSWEVPADGTLTVELPSTRYKDPAMTLVAYHEPSSPAAAQVVSRSVTVEWECPITYFFEPDPVVCPLEEAITTWAAEQVFERGRMLWFEEIQFGEMTEDDLLFVLYKDGEWQWYPDTWTEDQPEKDPTLVPPTGRVQPTRGFGKVWREHPEVKERLGWGLAPEQGYDALWQVPFRETPPGAAYIRTLADGVIEMSGWQSGTWQFVAP